MGFGLGTMSSVAAMRTVCIVCLLVVDRLFGIVGILGFARYHYGLKDLTHTRSGSRFARDALRTSGVVRAR